MIKPNSFNHHKISYVALISVATVLLATVITPSLGVGAASTTKGSQYQVTSMANRPAQLQTDDLPNANYGYVEGNKWYFAQYITPSDVQNIANIGGLPDFLATDNVTKMGIDAAIQAIANHIGAGQYVTAYMLYSAIFSDYMTPFKKAAALNRGVYVVTEVDVTNPTAGTNYVEYRIASY
ncbi:hypothetical protein [Lacticaseibacillus zeae]|uniref:Uncharacterized protein n=1 Tax=Lacticaseibacillus zeae subsp. silagei TaxID=3068307 RepID=A0ABD7Z8H5_LACZE|nr:MULTISPECIES: hypothetical protein [Lacticaseibacillus]MDE3316678.1 hypothetical protein [Lacticaseibacillus zeae]OFR97168.1 hypothetical protein HMPREF2861_07070 [Lactobacillus sp. HMSC068F07]WLV83470.1 hypothetical protein LACZS2_002711 [Lacticaseibacillus sp. NCIMB 15475]WLV86218.1 hypothetical protein LACZS1_002659 [Lacticaseibacillus sp. NCIMB 15474]